jgi:hypothetical protein
LATFAALHNVLRVGDRCGLVETLSESFSDKGYRPGMVTAGTSMYLLQQLVTLITVDTPHEYAGGPALGELTVDEDKCFGSAGDAPGFYLVGRELPLN